MKQSENRQLDFEEEVALDYNVFLKEQLAIKVHVKALKYEVCLRFELIKSSLYFQLGKNSACELGLWWVMNGERQV